MSDTDTQWFANYAEGFPEPLSLRFLAEQDAHASMYRDLYADAQKQIERMAEELHHERRLRQSAEADRRRMLQMLLGYMTTFTTEERTSDQSFHMKADVSRWLLAQSRNPQDIIYHTLSKMARQASAQFAALPSSRETTDGRTDPS